MRYIVGLLLGIGLIVLTFVLIFKAFSGGGNNAQKTPSINLNDYATTEAVMRYTIDGPEISDQQHNRIRISVSKDQVVYEQIQGYEGKLVQTRTYPTNDQAFSTFLRGLSLAGFTKGSKTTDDDERGYCPTGRRYIYEGINGGDSILRWWSTSCSNNQGNFRGSPSTIRTLFQQQVPDFGKLTADVSY